MRSPSEAVVTAVVTTAPNADVAEMLATRLVEERLAACANVIPGITSIFRWDGELQREGEVLVVFKTTAAAVDALSERLSELHPYDVPEVLALPVPQGSDRYVAWVHDEVTSP